MNLKFKCQRIKYCRWCTLRQGFLTSQSIHFHMAASNFCSHIYSFGVSVSVCVCDNSVLTLQCVVGKKALRGLMTQGTLLLPH